MKVFTTRANLPRVSTLCQVSNINQHRLFPGRDSFCIKGALFGTCFVDCNRNHTRPSDEEAEHTLQLLKPALDNPDSVKVNRY